MNHNQSRYNTRIILRLPFRFSYHFFAHQNWKLEIINSFSLYRGRKINNSVAESMNASIADLISNTKSIRNSERRKKRSMYAVNKTGLL